jgi:primosomal protein N' (replication factor Y)
MESADTTYSAEPKTYAAVVLNVPLDGPFHYRVPERLHAVIQLGVRVRVRFGKSEKIGYVIGFTGSTGLDEARIHEILELVDEEPLLDTRMIELGRRVAEYYACSWGRTLDSMVPGIVRGNTRPRTVTMVSANRSADELLRRADELERRAPRRAAILRKLANAAGEICANDLAGKGGMAALKPLEQSGDLILKSVPVSEDLFGGQARKTAPPTLTVHQADAVERVYAALDSGEFKVALLHGVTGSGKTEVYLRALERCIASGRQGIVLVPEIALTPQTVSRFRARFGRVRVLHSGLTDSARREQWRAVQNGDVDVVIGSRSAVFAPVPKLGLIVVDEEHESSFKHQSTPRCHDRDVAVLRAQQENALAILGSATPSLESYYNALAGKYDLIELPVRIDHRPMPSVELVHLGHEARGRGAIPILSRRLRLALETTLKRGEQAILLINRRGFHTAAACGRCGFVLRCPNCDVAMTFNPAQNKAQCHHCRHTGEVPSVCPGCSGKLKFLGTGTERVEEELARFFGRETVARMDSDSMKKREMDETTQHTETLHKKTLDAFQEGKTRILLGTQMVAKGLDFPNVTLVGVVNADISINMPDFRASERTFQLLAQVAGRTGRGDKGGHVIVQTFSPDHPCIKDAARHDYAGFAKRELLERRKHGYPPYARLARIVCAAGTADAARKCCAELVEAVKAHAADSGINVLGPAEAPIARIKGKARWHALIKAPDSAAMRHALQALRRKKTSGADVLIDVDPVGML